MLFVQKRCCLAYLHVCLCCVCPSTHLSFCWPACLSTALCLQSFHISKVLLFPHVRKKLSLHTALHLIQLGMGWRGEVVSFPFSSPTSPSLFISFFSPTSVFPPSHPSSSPSKRNHSFPISPSPSALLPHLYCPPTACSHSYGEYVSRAYYHTKWKGFFFLSSLFFSFSIALPSLSPSLLISPGTGVWELKAECTHSFSSLYKSFLWSSISCTVQAEKRGHIKHIGFT